MVTLASIEVGDAKPGESAVRRSTAHPDHLSERPLEGIDTIHDILLYNARVHGTKDGFGWRDIVDTHEEIMEVKKTVAGKEVTEKKSWKYWQLSEYKFINFIQMKDIVDEAAKGLVELGIAKGDVFNIYASTCLNWQIMNHACLQISTTVATAYDSLGESGLLHALNEPECVGIFTNHDLLPTLAKVLPKATTIRLVVYDGKASAADIDKLRSVRADVKLLNLDELRALGRGKPATHRAPTRDDVACIMYTSGTTGPPKGVVLTHANMVAAVGGIFDLMGDELQPTDFFLAYLPLAHILELIVEIGLSFYGMTTGYGRIKTLTDASVRNCLGDLRAFRPTILVGVPAVWESIRKGIIGKVNQSGSLRKAVFNAALSIKRARVPILSGVVDNAVFSQVRTQTGGRLRLAMSGGSKLSKETQEFLNLALTRTIQGYGLTESVAMCAIVTEKHYGVGTVGSPVPAVELKLKDHPEAGYLSSNTPPCGELLIRGMSVTKGYYKRDDLNKDPEIFTEDGWFRTGDIVQWNRDGTISIIDRIKNLVKLQGGEYVALERLESIYKSCNLIANICVHASSDARQPIAIIYPHEVNLRHALVSGGGESGNTKNKVYESMDLAEMCQDRETKVLIQQECNTMAKRSGFKTIEILMGIVLSSEEWTPQSGLVTAAQKLLRKKIEERYLAEIKDVYKSCQ